MRMFGSGAPSPRALDRSRASLGVVLALALCHAACAVSEVSDVTCETDFGLVDGKLDAGITVKATVRNKGETGDIALRAAISTSDGDWSRSRTLNLRGGETRRLSWFFHEPTIQATDIQCHVTGFP